MTLQPPLTPELPLTGDLLAAVFGAALDCIIVIDDEGRVVAFNHAAEQVFGYGRDQAIGRPLADLIVPERYRAAHAAGMARYLATGEARMLGRRVNIQALRADGSEIPVELALAEVRDGGRRLFTASLRDLSDQERAERARAESEARLHAFMDNAPVGMYLKDANGHYKMANPEMAKVFGRPVESVLNRTASDLLPPDEAAMVAAHDAELRATGRATSTEEYLSGRDDYAWTLVVRFPIPRADGAVEIGGFDIDITRLHEARRQLDQSREALHQAEKLAAMGSLLANVSHELNNPLAAVIGHAIMLEEDLAGTPHAARAGKLRAAADRCARIVQTFLAMARQRPPSRREIDLNAVVDGVLDLLDYALRTGSVRVVRDFAPDLPPLRADPDQLHQAIANIVINAQQAMAGRSGPRVLTVSTRAEDGRVLVEIADNGPGIAPGVAKRMFEPFFTTKPIGAGTGVGLSLALALVEAHQGRITLLPSSIGARFRLCFPIAQETDRTADANAPSAAPETGRRVLIVDDEADVAETLADLLRRNGCTPTVVASAAAARTAVARHTFDLILTDVRMPDEDGIALRDWLRHHAPALARRTIFVTGDTLGAQADRLGPNGDYVLLEKPFTPASLRAALAALDP